MLKDYEGVEHDFIQLAKNALIDPKVSITDKEALIQIILKQNTD